MRATSGNRGGRREAAALLLAAGRTIKAAAGEARVGVRTLRYWLEEEGFRRRVQELRSELFNRAAGGLCRLSGRAAAELGKLLGSQDERTRLNAAKAILESAPRLRDAAEFEARLQAIERQLAEAQEASQP
jgi:hypothetical protein